MTPPKIKFGTEDHKFKARLTHKLCSFKASLSSSVRPYLKMKSQRRLGRQLGESGVWSMGDLAG